MWIFRHKYKTLGFRIYHYFERHKVILIGDGADQQVRVDYGETLNSVVKSATIRIMLIHTLSKA